MALLFDLEKIFWKLLNLCKKEPIYSFLQEKYAFRIKKTNLWQILNDFFFEKVWQYLMRTISYVSAGDIEHLSKEAFLSSLKISFINDELNFILLLTYIKYKQNTIYRVIV